MLNPFEPLRANLTKTLRRRPNPALPEPKDVTIQTKDLDEYISVVTFLSICQRKFLVLSFSFNYFNFAKSRTRILSGGLNKDEHREFSMWKVNNSSRFSRDLPS